MLCVYYVFDERECQWRLHMTGARELFLALSKRREVDADNDFLMTWFLYHEVFGRLSQRPRAGLGDVITRYSSAVHDPRLIVGSIGCSIEMLGLINAIDAARGFCQSQSQEPGLIREKKEDLEYRLSAVKQHDKAEIDGRGDINQPTAATTELYRLAALLCLHQVLTQPEDQHRRVQHIDSAFSMLQSIKICTSPWPLFTIACEAITDEQRVLILDMLDRMDETTMFDLETTGPWFI
ncbi:hypothetical protein PRZ48_013889 [Zasmidium cellare]|uniref:Uncharacterized protein n=1 Tax=Zasmidium cellare TaxID=395010 RepID=A0ABR0E048_ZASCE|nr:hypothetical protein PRZ48_013889 [Zasmidium cellare]